ncbi:type 1 glutamine amidotransferase family protein [uncultured Methanoregula sp.]|uniref:type 1 glutamine amidotransferase family protein n=1 Tax=uncultured Methanoregula sp. TaxID=1005933 RepID=UPI002AABF99C|nr:type 1 glutamine amidotransferase family protein [uncultured Methanoregula sp.]
MPVIYLYILDTMADWEPAFVLSELHSGRFLKDPSLRYTVQLCGRTKAMITSMGGLPLVPGVLFEEIVPGRDDLVLLPGAEHWLDPDQKPVIEKVRRMLDGGVAVAAICGATLALAEAGLLDSRPHTSNDLGALRQFCPGYKGESHYVNEPAVTDGNLITAGGLAPIEFAYHVFRKLGVMNDDSLEAWYQLFSTRKPEYFFSLMQSLPGKPEVP